VGSADGASIARTLGKEVLWLFPDECSRSALQRSRSPRALVERSRRHTAARQSTRPQLPLPRQRRRLPRQASRITRARTWARRRPRQRAACRAVTDRACPGGETTRASPIVRGRVSPSVGKATPNSRRERNGDTEVASRAHSDWLEQRLEAGSLHSSGRDCRRGRGGGKAKNPTGPWGADDLDGQKRGDPRRRGRGPPTHEAKVVRRWRANAPARSCGAPGRFTNLPLTRVIAEAVASANPRTGEPVPMRNPARPRTLHGCLATLYPSG
jgi:hypothetical protein